MKWCQNEFYQDSFTNQNLQKYKVTPANEKDLKVSPFIFDEIGQYPYNQTQLTPRTYTDSELALSVSVEMFQLIKDRIANGK